MRQHAHLTTMVGFVREHVAQHFHADRPGPSPAVSAKFLDPAPVVPKRFREHFRAASGALGQSRPRLLRSAVCTVELSWNLQVRSRKTDPLGSHIMYVREDRRDAARLAGRLGSPERRRQIFDQGLVEAFIGGENPDRGPPELSLNLRLTHCPLFLVPRNNNKAAGMRSCEE
jgi:hypothetical protein